MTLLEMSVQYAERAAAIRERITMLRGMERQELCIAMFDGFTAEEAAAAYDLRQAEQIALYQN